MTSDTSSFLDLIPDYVQGCLDSETRAAFEERLTSDAELKKELDDFKMFKALYGQVNDDLPPPSEAIFQKIDTAIASQEADRFRHHHPTRFLSPSHTSRLLTGWERLKASFSLPWGLAAVQALLIVILLVPGNPDPHYQTLGSKDDSLAVPGSTSFNIVFSDSAVEAQIRTLLVTVHASIIDGPSAEGRYVIVMPEDDNLQQSIEKLQQEAIVHFLEPLE
ncbi:MAG: hypothetical protein IH612_12595 [Desulfofustis sp.]|nr:hypothetical protein [Desulfofustis sp.]